MTKFHIRKINGKSHRNILFRTITTKLADTPNYELVKATYTEGFEKKPKTHFIVKEKGFFGQNISYAKNKFFGLRELKKAEQEKATLTTTIKW